MIDRLTLSLTFIDLRNLTSLHVCGTSQFIYLQFNVVLLSLVWTRDGGIIEDDSYSVVMESWKWKQDLRRRGSHPAGSEPERLAHSRFSRNHRCAVARHGRECVTCRHYCFFLPTGDSDLKRETNSKKT